MLTVDELLRNVDEYRLGRLSFENFENWFEDNSNGAYRVPRVGAACAAVDAAISQYYFDHIGEPALKQELANAVRPFERKVATSSVTVTIEFPTLQANGLSSQIHHADEKCMVAGAGIITGTSSPSRDDKPAERIQASREANLIGELVQAVA